jgi:hypothetical protein
MKTIMERWRYKCEHSGTDPFIAKGTNSAGLAAYDNQTEPLEPFVWESNSSSSAERQEAMC